MTTLGSGFVALIVPAFVRVFKKYIPGGYVGPVYLSASVLFGIIAIAATGGFDDTYKTLLEITPNELQSWVNKLSKGGYKAQLSGKKKPRSLSPYRAGSRTAGAIPRLHRRAHQRSARPADSGSRLQEPQSPHPPHMVR